MAGGYYTALSGMHTRALALDRVASDIANSSTAGYKTERNGTIQADRPQFDAVLQAAVDVTGGESRVDLRPGSLRETARPMDVAIQGDGFLEVATTHGTRYTRNGNLMRGAEGLLITQEGDTVIGKDGPIKVGLGVVEIDPDGTVREGKSAVGMLKVVDFPPGTHLERDGGSRFRIDGEAKALEKPSFAAGTLEQSNVQIVERIVELSDISRNYETLLKAVAVLMNDVDRGAITELGRR